MQLHISHIGSRQATFVDRSMCPETNQSGLPRSVSAKKAIGPAANIADGRPGSCNRNLPPVKYALKMAWDVAAGPNFPPASAAAISTSRSSAKGLDGE